MKMPRVELEVPRCANWAGVTELKPDGAVVFNVYRVLPVFVRETIRRNNIVANLDPIINLFTLYAHTFSYGLRNNHMSIL